MRLSEYIQTLQEYADDQTNDPDVRVCIGQEPMDIVSLQVMKPGGVRTKGDRRYANLRINYSKGM